MNLPNKIGKLIFEMYIKPIYSKRCLQESVNKKDKLLQKYKKNYWQTCTKNLQLQINLTVKDKIVTQTRQGVKKDE